MRYLSQGLEAAQLMKVSHKCSDLHSSLNTTLKARLSALWL